MTKSSKVINYLFELDGKSVVDLLMDYMTENAWENLYDRLDGDGVFDTDENSENV